MYCHALLSVGESGLFAEGAGSTRWRVAGGAFRRPVKREQPSKEVVNELERMLQPQERGKQKLLQIFLTPLSRISNAHKSSQRTATSSLGEVNSTIQQQPLLVVIQRQRTTKGILPRTARYSPTMQAKNPAYYCNTNKLKGIHMDNLTETVFSRFTSHFSLPKSAFTLAEVLITLGIIGVVAALTIPSLIQKYQMKSFEVAFKKQYSVLNNAINYIQLNNNLSECYVTVIKVIYQGNLVDNYSGNNSDCVALKNELISNLKLTPISQYSGFTSISKVRADGGVMINGSIDYYSALMYSSNFYLLPDGVVVMFSDSDVRPFFYNDLIFIDVNGAKGPNRWGYDVFCLTLVSKNGVLRLSDEYASIAEKGGKLPRTILLNEKENNTNFKQYGVW